jgi:hypothetical protein
MKSKTLSHRTAILVGGLLVLPSFYFITSAWLNYNLGITTPWKLVELVFGNPAHTNFGFSTNMLIVLAPVVGMLLNISNILSVQFQHSDEHIGVQLTISKFSWSWVVLLAGATCMVAIMLYLLSDNCNC